MNHVNVSPTDGFNSHPGQSFSLSLCGPISISRANAHSDTTDVSAFISAWYPNQTVRGL